MGEFAGKTVPWYAKKIWYASIAFRWLLNAVAVATPLTFFFLAVCIGDTIYMIVFNKFWAHGSFILIANWLFLISQTIMAIPLLYEIAPVLRILRPFRVLALSSAFWYNFLWFAALFDLIMQ